MCLKHFRRVSFVFYGYVCFEVVSVVGFRAMVVLNMSESFCLVTIVSICLHAFASDLERELKDCCLAFAAYWN